MVPALGWRLLRLSGGKWSGWLLTGAFNSLVQTLTLIIDVVDGQQCAFAFCADVNLVIGQMASSDADSVRGGTLPASMVPVLHALGQLGQ